ncbi:hypothetical protein ACHAW6_005833 [Cyclotella cf. meneghiniana]
MQQAFDKIGELEEANDLAAYLDNNKWFHISTDASDFPLGWLTSCLFLLKAVKITAELYHNGEGNALYCGYP